MCAPTAKNAVLNVSDLETLLASGNVEVTTGGPGVQANNIAIDSALTWSAASTLALDAHVSIAVSQSYATGAAVVGFVGSNEGDAG